MSALRSIASADLPPQAYAHVVPRVVVEMILTPENWRPIENREYGVKPQPNTGMWTATVTRQGEDGRPTDTTWMQWMREEEYGSHASSLLTEITPISSARVLLIDNLADLQAIVVAYSQTSRYGGVYPDWARMAQDWDAVYMTDDGQWATRLTEPGLYSWDVECVLWLNHAFTVGRTTEPAMTEAVAR